jgi:hypothetical protein
MRKNKAKKEKKKWSGLKGMNSNPRLARAGLVAKNLAK